MNPIVMHQCEGMRGHLAEIEVAPGPSGAGAVLSLSDGGVDPDDPAISVIYFCPWCGEHLGTDENAYQMAPVIEAAKKYNDVVVQWWSQIFGDISDERRFALVNAMEKAKDALALGVVETFEEMGKGNPDATKRKQSGMNMKWGRDHAKEGSDAD